MRCYIRHPRPSHGQELVVIISNTKTDGPKVRQCAMTLSGEEPGCPVPWAFSTEAHSSKERKTEVETEATLRKYRHKVEKGSTVRMMRNPDYGL